MCCIVNYFNLKYTFRITGPFGGSKKCCKVLSSLEWVYTFFAVRGFDWPQVGHLTWDLLILLYMLVQQSDYFVHFLDYILLIFLFYLGREIYFLYHTHQVRFQLSSGLLFFLLVRCALSLNIGDLFLYAGLAVIFFMILRFMFNRFP